MKGPVNKYSGGGGGAGGRSTELVGHYVFSLPNGVGHVIYFSASGRGGSSYFKWLSP